MRANNNTTPKRASADKIPANAPLSKGKIPKDAGTSEFTVRQKDIAVRHEEGPVRQEHPPSPSPSGTSGSPVGENSSEGEAQNDTKCSCQDSMPDVPDARVSMPDVRPTGDQLCRTGRPPCRTDGTVMPDFPTGVLPVRGIARVGRITSPRQDWRVLENPDLASVLREAPAEPDWGIEADSRTDLSFIDIDTHHWKTPPDAGALIAQMAALTPEPDAWWITQGQGLRLVYIGPSHSDRALAVAFAVPSSFRVELLKHTRHPLAVRSDLPGAKCSPVVLTGVDFNRAFEFKAVGRLTPDLITESLATLKMEAGARYDHDMCPINPDAETNALSCVVVLDVGVYCHRCAGHGVRFRPHLKPGWVPFTAIAGRGITVLDVMAREFVHWMHAMLVLLYHHANLGEDLLRAAYKRALEHAHTADDLRIRSTFNRDLDFVRGDGLWLDNLNFKPTHLDNDAADGLPYCQYVGQNRNGDPVLKVDGPRRAQAKHRTPRGYTSVRPFCGITFLDDAGASIPVQVPPHPTHAIKLLEDPIPLDAAFQRLEASFPKVNRSYLQACLAAGICGEAGQGQPPMVCGTGPTGSGKTETVRLAASFCGEDARKLQFCDNAEEFARNLGMMLASGCRFVVFDEAGKVPNLFKFLAHILQIGAYVDWRPLYQNQRVRTPNRAAFFFPCVSFPDAFTGSPEFLRRTRALHLYRQTPKWAETSGGDTAAWRDRTKENALVANSILTHTWRLCHEHEFRFL